MCGKSFNSVGPHNRRCTRCNYLLDHAKAGTYYEPFTYPVGRHQFLDMLDTLQKGGQRHGVE
ncbi:MAG TPA: hypothetical protein ACFYEA_01575 [Candidatus Tripitaka californicus]|uniref:hypothetical protein n=1 Tax=Candidatus Tripitaka californicus TaxID=3367616 RepID=UPI00402A2216